MSEIRRGVGRTSVDDWTIVALAIAEASGAWWAAGIPLVVALVAVGIACIVRHPVVLVIAALVLTSSLAARSWSGLESSPERPIDAEVTLVSDPVRTMGAVRVDVRFDGRRYDAWARGRPAAALEARAAGQRVVITGRTARVEMNTWRASRHLSGRIVVDEVVSWSAGNALTRAANGLRGVLVRGAESLPNDLRPLFGGFVLGDTRGQSALTVEDFRRAGLTHLLVVSGSNVAFLLVVASPLLARLRLRPRLVVTLTLLTFFAVLTRMEPSVLRATAMAALAATGSMLGRPQSSVRLLAVAVVVLLVVDPLLIHSFGFTLSVAACAGIIFLSGPIAEVIPGPRRLAQALGITIAAQLGVSPVLLQLTRGIPVVTLAANLLAEPVAGFVMGWGMTAGVLAGAGPRWLASLLHQPTRLGLWWIDSVARWSAGAPFGSLGISGLAIVALGILGVVALHRRGRSAAALVVAATAIVAAVMFPGGGVGGVRGSTDVGVGAVLWSAPDPDGAWARVLVVDGRAEVGRVLAALQEVDVGRLDVVIVASASRSAVATVSTLSRRVEIGEVWVADDAQVVALGAGPPVVKVNVGDSVVVGGVVVEVSTVTPKLGVDVSIPGVGSPDAVGPDDPGAGIEDL